MSERADVAFISDTKEAVVRINAYIEDLSYEQFLEDKKTQDAVVRNLEIIGEAAKNISEELKDKYPKIPWKDLAGLRDKLINHYFGVNFDVVWNIVKRSCPRFSCRLKESQKLNNLKVVILKWLISNRD